MDIRNYFSATNVNEWNELTEDVVQSGIVTFKRQLDHHLIHNHRFI